MSDDHNLSPESHELLRLVKAHVTESTQCIYRRVDEVAKEQKIQRHMLERVQTEQATHEERSKSHEKRLDKVEIAEARVTRKAYALSGAQAALFAILHFFKGSGH